MLGRVVDWIFGFDGDVDVDVPERQGNGVTAQQAQADYYDQGGGDFGGREMTWGGQWGEEGWNWGEPTGGTCNGSAPAGEREPETEEQIRCRRRNEKQKASDCDRDCNCTWSSGFGFSNNGGDSQPSPSASPSWAGRPSPPTWCECGSGDVSRPGRVFDCTGETEELQRTETPKMSAGTSTPSADNNDGNVVVEEEEEEEFESWSPQHDDVPEPCPFYQITPKKSRGLIFTMAWLVMGLMLLAIRLPVVILLTFILVIVHLVSLVVPTATLQRKFYSSSLRLSCRLLLFFMGFHVITYIRIPQPSTSKQRRRNANLQESSSNLIVSTHTSYVDILFYGYRCAPEFIYPPLFEEKEGHVATSGFFGALYRAVTDSWPVMEETYPVEAILQEAQCDYHCPVVVFPEGTTTNGKSIISCRPVLPPGFDQDVSVMALKYKTKYCSPTFPSGSFLVHFFLLLMQVSNKLEVREGVAHLRSTSHPTGDIQESLCRCRGVQGCTLLSHNKENYLRLLDYDY
ncbi:1-acylglycerol-3-phosphate O-acyltransferase [Pelomyxa schiedti]|nr:1-acylglycerol-3-phosphate O-acyltransferase [Pelomyxa schiedti]